MDLKKQVNYIQEKLKTHFNFSVYTGKLSEKQEKIFSEHFSFVNKYSGYTKFIHKGLICNICNQELTAVSEHGEICIECWLKNL